MVLRTHRDSPLLLTIAVAAMVWAGAGATGVIERVESRLRAAPRSGPIALKLRHLGLAARRGLDDRADRGRRNRGHEPRRSPAIPVQVFLILAGLLFTRYLIGQGLLIGAGLAAGRQLALDRVTAPVAVGAPP